MIKTINTRHHHVCIKKRKKSEKNESNVSGMVSTSLSLETTNEYLSVICYRQNYNGKTSIKLQ